MADEEFKCTLKEIKSIEKWLEEGKTKNEEGENCPPCLLAPLGSFYLGVLEENGLKKEAEGLQDIWKDQDGVKAARMMDDIKKRVPEEIRKKLLEIDCSAQSYRE